MKRAPLLPLAVLPGFFIIALGAKSAHAEDCPDGAPQPGQTTLARPLKVTMESDDPKARLVKFDFMGSGSYRGFYDIAPVCGVPCSASVLPGLPYRVVGPGITPSPVFRLEPDRDVDLLVRRGSWGAHSVGTVLSVLGAAYLPLGGGLLIGQEAFGDARSQSLVPLGVTFLAVGAIALAVGVPLWLGSRTHVTIDQGASRTEARARLTSPGLALAF